MTMGGYYSNNPSKAKAIGYEILPYLPCSLDLLSTDNQFFKHLKNLLCKKYFKIQNVAEIAFNKSLPLGLQNYTQLK